MVGSICHSQSKDKYTVRESQLNKSHCHRQWASLTTAEEKSKTLRNRKEEISYKDAELWQKMGVERERGEIRVWIYSML